VPGAFTPTCSSQAPGYIEKYDQFKAKGINEIYIITVNDAYVTKCVLSRDIVLFTCYFYSTYFVPVAFIRAWKEKLAPNGTRKSPDFLHSFFPLCTD
jgi:hypothetical protein